MLLSVIIPACHAQTTITRAVSSVVAQQGGISWEAIVVADDGFDYATHLAIAGITDQRVRFVATGGNRTGCHAARNVGLAASHGDVIAHFDADDVMRPDRLARLLPLALAEGAATDDVSVVRERDGATLYHALEVWPGGAGGRLGVADVMALSTPLFPLARRDLAWPRLAGVEYAEDVVANARLADRLGGLPMLCDVLLEYRVIEGSLSHADRSGDCFDEVYAAYLVRCETGDGFGLSPAGRRAAAAGFAAKRALNDAFRRARTIDSTLDFQSFVARSLAPASIAALANPPR